MGSFAHGILQTRIVEWDAMPFWAYDSRQSKQGSSSECFQAELREEGLVHHSSDLRQEGRKEEGSFESGQRLPSALCRMNPSHRDEKCGE